VLVEADPYGGDLAVRLRTNEGAALPEAPTVLTVATAARTAPSRELVTRYAHRINDQVSVVPGHLVAEQLTGVPDWEPFAGALSASQAPVVADVGRLHATSPMLPVAARADALVVVGRAEAGSVIRLRERLNRLVPALAEQRGARPHLLPVLVSPSRHGAADVADLRRILADSAAGPLIVGTGYLALDAGGVRRLERGERPTGQLARTALLRTARTLAATIAEVLEPPAPPASVPAAAGQEER
jgi:hypothetical protein